MNITENLGLLRADNDAARLLFRNTTDEGVLIEVWDMIEGRMTTWFTVKPDHFRDVATKLFGKVVNSEV